MATGTLQIVLVGSTVHTFLSFAQSVHCQTLTSPEVKESGGPSCPGDGCMYVQEQRSENQQPQSSIHPTFKHNSTLHSVPLRVAELLLV